MKLGMVTYMWGAEWDLPTLIKICTETGFEGVELRTTHKHGVEPSLSAAQRRDVRRRFEDSPVQFIGPGTACEFQSADPAVVRQNIELTAKFVELSHDLGGTGVKVRPNGLVTDEDRRRTIDRIGNALQKCGEHAAGYGQEIRLEVHGVGTEDLGIIREIVDIADHDQVVVCWNSNPEDVTNGSVARSFDLVKHKLGGTVHINELHNARYPYRELFALLRKANYEGYCLSESPATKDPEQVMKYYKALWRELAGPA
ncbi:MAG: sugar phosphate isomerase/epimerase family protein [Planctomycetaceae bacterium]